MSQIDWVTDWEDCGSVEPMVRGRNKTGYRQEHPTIYDLFAEEEIPHLIAAARMRILREVDHATIVVWGALDKPVRVKTGDYIVGVDGSPSKLAELISKQQTGRFIKKKDLPKWAQKLRPKAVQRIIVNTQKSLMELALPPMIASGEIKYNEALGTWKVKRSLMLLYPHVPTQTWLCSA